MFDIVFVDIPYIAEDMNSKLAVEMDKYRTESEIIVNQITNRTYQTKPFHYSSGILCLSSYLKQYIPNIKVGYIHQEINISKLQEYAKATAVMAFSTMTFSMPQITALAKTAKLANPNVHIVLGGYHATYFPKALLEKYSFIDCIFLKEGEKSLLQYMTGVPLSEIHGFAYRDAEGVIHVDNECDWLSASEIPLPDYSLIQDSIHLFNISLSTMRGCIGHCRFCVNNDYWSFPRLIPLEKVIDELKFLKAILAKESVIHINDNVFTFQLSRLHKLYSLMQENELTDYFIFECDTLANQVSAPIVRLLHKIGVYKVCIGFEDCCDSILQLSNKPVSFSQNLEAAKIIKSEAPDICVYAYWLIALPGSNTETMNRNLKTMYELIVNKWVDIISPKVFIPYPGTVFFDDFTSFGINELNYDWRQYERRNPPYPYKHHKLSEDDIFSYLLAALRICHTAYQCVHKEPIL